MIFDIVGNKMDLYQNEEISEKEAREYAKSIGAGYHLVSCKQSVGIKDLFEDLRDMGFRCIIISNESKKRVTPFKELLCVDSAYHAMKPFKFKIKKFNKSRNIYF